MNRRLSAEFLGTFWLVFGGCGTAVIASGIPEIGVGLLGVSFAFGLTVVTMAYAFGHISGGHFNPAVTLGAWLGGRVEAVRSCPTSPPRSSPPSRQRRCSCWSPTASRATAGRSSGLAVNGYGDHSPAGYGLSRA